MNAPFDPSMLATRKFAVGQTVSRKEDHVLLRGEGRYTDDLSRLGQVYAVMVRSRMAHGLINSVDTAAAREMPGVHAVTMAEDLDAAEIRNMPAAANKHRNGSATPRPAQRPLATARVCYVGEPIAMVVAQQSNHDCTDPEHGKEHHRRLCHAADPRIDKCLFTNTTPVGAYRGAGRLEGNYYMERLVETAAREMDIDKVELRRNHIQPQQMPYKAPSGMLHDCGEFPAVMEKALVAADWNGYGARQAASRARGKIRGRSMGHYLEVTADAGNEMGGIRFEDNGEVTIVTGTLDYGQGHASPFAQVLSARLGVPFEKIRLLQGDSDELVAGGGIGGSRSMMQSGGAIVEASDIVIERGKNAAAHFLEAAVADIEFSRGRFTVAGTDLGIGIMELAERLRLEVRLPDDMPRTLDVKHVFKGVPSAFPNGCHIAEVELDPETGVVEIASYATVNDFGVLVNPMLVEGQAHGGIAQGIGQALMEMVAYDEDGQLITGSYMDYALARANDFPGLGFKSHPVPATTNPLGATGCGEAGCAGSLPAVMNAVVDALSEFDITHIDIPATPLRIWQAIQAARP